MYNFESNPLASVFVNCLEIINSLVYALTICPVVQDYFKSGKGTSVNYVRQDGRMHSSFLNLYLMHKQDTPCHHNVFSQWEFYPATHSSQHLYLGVTRLTLLALDEELGFSSDQESLLSSVFLPVLV